MTAAHDMLPLELAPPDGSPGGALPLRPYQAEAVAAVLGAPGRGITRPMFVLPCGGGKTVVFSHVIGQRPGRALVIAHREELLAQAADKLRAVCGPGLDIGVVKAQRDETGARCIVASVQTLARPGRAERLGRFSTVICDENHHSVSKTYLDIFGRLGCMDEGGPLTVGCTATAGRTDKVGLGHVWQEIVYQRGIIQMIAEGYLVDVRGQQIGSDFNMRNLRTRQGDYTDGSIEAELDRSDALRDAVRGWLEYAPGRPTAAFTPTIATAHQLAGEFRQAGVPAEAVDGTMHPDERRAILARLRSGETLVVPNAQVLCEGFDEPRISCVLLLRPTKSKPFFQQMTGRALRPFLGKDDALILDMTGMAEELGLATIADLAGLKPGSVPDGGSLLEAAEESQRSERHAYAAAAQTRQFELLRRSELHWIQVDGGAWVLPCAARQVMYLLPAGADDEDAWLVYRAVQGRMPQPETGRAMPIDWARGVGEEVARAHDGVFSRSDQQWRTRAATAGQVARLGQLGVLARSATRGEASDLITAREAAPAIAWLRRRLAS